MYPTGWNAHLPSTPHESGTIPSSTIDLVNSWIKSLELFSVSKTGETQIISTSLASKWKILLRNTKNKSFLTFESQLCLYHGVGGTRPSSSLLLLMVPLHTGLCTDDLEGKSGSFTDQVHGLEQALKLLQSCFLISKIGITVLRQTLLLLYLHSLFILATETLVLIGEAMTQITCSPAQALFTQWWPNG